MALIIAHMINKKAWSIILLLLALLAAYSRVYLAQHFPIDILAGMCIGIFSAILSLMIYKRFNRYVNKRSVLKQDKISSA
jgi:membrane-associated phospholipid phosphatase